MTRWEYVTTPLILHNEAKILNNWGAEGWELVSIQPGPAGGPVAYFKRPVPDVVEPAPSPAAEAGL